MNISSAQYVTDLRGGDSTILAVIDGTPMTVPQDPSNRHYAAVLEWAQEDGNTIQEAD
jgi:hypothetical protein